MHNVIHVYVPVLFSGEKVSCITHTAPLLLLNEHIIDDFQYVNNVCKLVIHYSVSEEFCPGSVLPCFISWSSHVVAPFGRSTVMISWRLTFKSFPACFCKHSTWNSLSQESQIITVRGPNAFPFPKSVLWQYTQLEWRATLREICASFPWWLSSTSARLVVAFRIRGAIGYEFDSIDKLIALRRTLPSSRIHLLISPIRHWKRSPFASGKCLDSHLESGTYET